MQWNKSCHRQFMCILQDLRSTWQVFFLASILEASEQVTAEETFQEASNRCSQLPERASLTATKFGDFLFKIQVIEWSFTSLLQLDGSDWQKFESREKKGKLRKPCKKMSLAGVNEYTSVLYESQPTWWDSFKIIAHSALWQPVTPRPCISRWFK